MHVEGAGNPQADDYLGPQLCLICSAWSGAWCVHKRVVDGTPNSVAFPLDDPFEVAGGTPIDSFARIPQAVLWAFVHREWPLLESWRRFILSLCWQISMWICPEVVVRTIIAVGWFMVYQHRSRPKPRDCYSYNSDHIIDGFHVANCQLTKSSASLSYTWHQRLRLRLSIGFRQVDAASHAAWLTQQTLLISFVARVNGQLTNS